MGGMRSGRRNSGVIPVTTAWRVRPQVTEEETASICVA
jgi:hypothetical protein